jgi:hypothetical protein
LIFMCVKKFGMSCKKKNGPGKEYFSEQLPLSLQ